MYSVRASAREVEAKNGTHHCIALVDGHNVRNAIVEVHLDAYGPARSAK